MHAQDSRPPRSSQSRGHLWPIDQPPPVPRWQGHVTVIRDAVLDRIGPDFGPVALALYVVLERHADERGRCHPSQETLGKKIGATDRTVRNMLERLETGGYVVVHRRYNALGKRDTCEYELPFHLGVAPAPAVSPPPAAPPTEPLPERLPARASVSGSGSRSDKVVPVVPVVEGVRETPPSPPKGGAVAVAPSPLDQRFETFWTAYPRKVGKQAARRAWARLRPDDALLARMLAAVAQQRRSAQWTRDGGQYIPHPQTWLNQGRWDDEHPAAAPSALADRAQPFDPYGSWKQGGHA